jgi:hypothetical protein
LWQFRLFKSNSLAATNLSFNGITTASPLPANDKLVSLNGRGSLIITPAGAIGGAIGICLSAGKNACAGAGNTPGIVVGGDVACVFDNTAVAGHYVQIGTVAGDCADAGASYPNNGAEVIGLVLTSGTGTQTVPRQPFLPIATTIFAG